jgi:hypothetical protein
MRKLISEILDSENVIEKCCELEILNRNWKLLLFDSGVDNLVYMNLTRNLENTKYVEWAIITIASL